MNEWQIFVRIVGTVVLSIAFGTIADGLGAPQSIAWGIGFAILACGILSFDKDLGEPKG